MVKYLTVIKNVAYFPSQCALNSQPVMSAVLDSLQAQGIVTQENSMHADAVVIWSALWAGRMRNNLAVYEHYRQQGRPVIFVEVGALHRDHTWKIAVDTLTNWIGTVPVNYRSSWPIPNKPNRTFWLPCSIPRVYN